MYRQRQSQGAVRIRLRGAGGDPGYQAQRRPVCLHAKALHGNSFDGHTLGPVIAELEALTRIETRRIHVDKGYRGHNHSQKFRVWISGQVRRVTAPIRREMRRRAAVEPVIGCPQLPVRVDTGVLSLQPLQ